MSENSGPSSIPTGPAAGRKPTFVASWSATPWIFARTMPQNPHEYTLRRSARNEVFEAAVRYVREHGRMERFRGRPYRTWYFGEHKYWTLGAPLADTILVNRKALKDDDC